MPKRLAIPAPRCPPTVPPRIECASCHRVVLTGREPAVLWGDQGWCTGCWFQDTNRMGQVSQQAPLCSPDAHSAADRSFTTRFRIARIPEPGRAHWRRRGSSTSAAMAATECPPDSLTRDLR